MEGGKERRKKGTLFYTNDIIDNYFNAISEI